MFKSVEYTGFDGKPELKAKAERLIPALAGEINSWRDDVRVRWSPHTGPSGGVLDLSLRLALPNGVEGEATGTFLPEDFARDRRLAWRCRRVWSDLLGVLLDKQHRRIQEVFLEPAEA